MPGLGRPGSALLIIGLAPGLRGANATGRPFTGDHSGALLQAALSDTGIVVSAPPETGHGRMIACRITNAVRCAPPGNRPTAAEAAACRRFVAAELAAVPERGVVLAVGRLAHGAVLAALGIRPGSAPFGHGAVHVLPGDRRLVDSYHCSRLNTSTGRLTPKMLADVLRLAARLARHARGMESPGQGSTSGR